MAFELVGHGPAATGGGPGWAMRPDLYAKCLRCGDYVSLDPSTTDGCSCGALFRDSDAYRLGSPFGDDAIAVYRVSGPDEPR